MGEWMGAGLLVGWMSGWMDEWMVEKRDEKPWGKEKYQKMNEGRAATYLHISIFFTSFPFPQPSVSYSWSLSIYHCFCSLSLSYSDQMSNSRGAVAWLINALEEPREVEHNKQTEGGEKKSEGWDWREKTMSESLREWARPHRCLRASMYQKPQHCHRKANAPSGLILRGRCPSPHQWKCCLFSSLLQSCSLILYDRISQHWGKKGNKDKVKTKWVGSYCAFSLSASHLC